ncbi:MAG: sarcosine oxidase subunit gamma [Pseudomonadota bacterium]
MTDLIPLTALGRDAPREVRFGGLQLREMSAMALASLTVAGEAELPQPFGLTLPEPGHWREGAEAAALWIGPRQWLIVAEGRAEEDFAAHLKAACPGAYVTEQTDAWVIVEISSEDGAAIDALLERLVNLSPAAVRPGRATRTLLGHLSVFVIRPAPERLMVLGMRSAAGSLWHDLESAVRRQAARA